MNRHILANIVDQMMQSCIDAGYTSSRFISIHLARPEHCFMFDWEICSEEFLHYDYRNAVVQNVYTEREYPNVLLFLCTELDALFTVINHENQQEYFNSLTGAGLRQLREERDA